MSSDGSLFWPGLSLFGTGFPPESLHSDPLIGNSPPSLGCVPFRRFPSNAARGLLLRACWSGVGRRSHVVHCRAMAPPGASPLWPVTLSVAELAAAAALA